MRFFLISFFLACSLVGPRFATAQQVASVCAPDTSMTKWVALLRARLIKYAGCADETACLECATVPAQIGGVSLTDYFRQQLPLQAQAFTGMVLVNLNLDAAGAVCCSSVQNLTDRPHEQVQALHLDQVVARMPAWRPVRVDGRPVSSSTALRLVFQGQQGVKAEPFFPGGLHPMFTDTSGLHQSGWTFVTHPRVIPLDGQPGYVEFTFGISATGLIHSVTTTRTNASAAQESACRRSLEGTHLQPAAGPTRATSSYYTFTFPGR